MATEVLLVGLGSFVASVLLTALARKISLSYSVMDVPNARSSHSMPTPRGGGVAIVLTSIAAWCVLAHMQALPVTLFVAVLGSLVVACVGLLDDYNQLPALTRLSVHIAAAVWALVWLGGLAPIRIGDGTFTLGWSGYVIAIVGIVWILNLFNFMDGIDGAAGSEAIFVVLVGSYMTRSFGVESYIPALGFVLSMACLGFLVWNWPPAKIFMGDVGSGYLGYVIAVLAIAAARDNPVALFVWLTLGGVFFMDATVTLVRRLLRGDRVYEAHRSHAYQWLSRRWQSHLRVTLLVWAINLLWLLPLAWCCVLFPNRAWLISLGALAPIGIGAFVAGAGRSE